MEKDLREGMGEDGVAINTRCTTVAFQRWKRWGVQAGGEREAAFRRLHNPIWIQNRELSRWQDWPFHVTPWMCHVKLFPESVTLNVWMNGGDWVVIWIVHSDFNSKENHFYLAFGSCWINSVHSIFTCLFVLGSNRGTGLHFWKHIPWWWGERKAGGVLICWSCTIISVPQTWHILSCLSSPQLCEILLSLFYRWEKLRLKEVMWLSKVTWLVSKVTTIWDQFLSLKQTNNTCEVIHRCVKQGVIISLSFLPVTPLR